MPRPSESAETHAHDEGPSEYDVDLRRTDSRADHLDRLAKITTSTSTQVQLGERARNRRVADGDGHCIEVPAEPIAQQVSALPTAVWNLVEQETLTFHGIGHLQWTDFDAYRRYSRTAAEADAREPDSGPELGALYRYLFNAGEDACVDAFLDREFDLRDELILSYENLVAPYRERNCLGAVAAVGFGLLDYGFYDSGVWQSILDGDTKVVKWNPDADAGRVSAFVASHVLSRDASVSQFDDRIERVMSDALAQPDGSRRAELFFEFARHVHETLSGVAVPETGIRSDFSVGIEQQADPEAAPHVGQSPTDDTTRNEPDDSDGSGKSDGSDEDGRNDDEDASALIDDLCNGSDSETRDSDPRHEPVTFEGYTDVDTEEYEATLESQIQKQRRHSEGDQVDAEKQVTHSFSGLDGGIEVPTDWARTDITINEITECERQSQTIARILRATLQQERTSSRRYGTERGKLESSQLPYAVTGRRNIRSERRASEEKSYSIQFILDRSISMHGSSIKHAQRAVYQLGLGLYDVGAEVSVLSVYRNIPHLEVPFGSDPSEHRNRLFSGRTKGGTPLSHSLAVAQSELADGQFDNHLILVVTDGYPDHEEAYREYLASLPVPVYGVYINETEQRTGDHDRYFDSVRYATPSTIDDRCRELCYDFVNQVR